MLSRLLPKPSQIRALTLISSKLQSQQYTSPKTPIPHFSARFFSSSNGDGSNKAGNWDITGDRSSDALFSAGKLIGDGDTEWNEDDVNRPWNLEPSEEDEIKGGLFKIEDEDEEDLSSSVDSQETEIARAEKAMRLEREEQALTAILKGSGRAFGDLITSSGITDEMIDSLIALKDFEGIEGLPPLKELRKERGKKKSLAAEKERLKLEEAAKARVRQVDDKGRAYGTGRRKCSVARVWIQPGEGKFLVNDKDLDVYFPIIDYRAALLRPFSETKTLGLWNVNCTVKGGGVTGQAGAILLGISRALQNWEPDLRPPLKAVGFLTRDPRMVERKKPGKAKARKSFQWVKR